MADSLMDRVAKAIARGCYAELVDKGDLSCESYVEQYWHLFKQAAREAAAELENA